MRNKIANKFLEITGYHVGEIIGDEDALFILRTVQTLNKKYGNSVKCLTPLYITDDKVMFNERSCVLLNYN